MNTFEKIETESLDGLLNEINKIDLNEWELIGHPQNYIDDNYVRSSSYGGEGLQKLKPKNIFYIFLKKKNIY